MPWISIVSHTDFVNYIDIVDLVDFDLQPDPATTHIIILTLTLLTLSNRKPTYLTNPSRLTLYKLGPGM